MKEPVKPMTRPVQQPHPQPHPQSTRDVRETVQRPATTVKVDPNKTVMKTEPAAAPRPEQPAPVENPNDINDPQKRHEAFLKSER